MATEVVRLSGKAKYIFVLSKSQFDDWRILLYPNAESLEIIKKLKSEGVKNHLKKDDDGYNMQFKRPVVKEIKGKLITYEPPVVVDKDGNAWPPGVAIGSDSDVTIKLEVYEHGTPGGGKAKACRLQGIRVDNLVPYNKDVEWSAEQQALVEGLDTAPKPIW
jgi:hypothetical protein